MVDTVHDGVQPATARQRPTAGLHVRRVDPSSTEFARWLDIVRTVFFQPPLRHPEASDARRAHFAPQRLTAAVDDADTLVATFRSYDTGLAVPGGGRLGVDAISSVTVLPTHHRRGALTSLMEADLRAAVTRGCPAAVLIASEATIYGRFGFAPSTRAATWTVDLPQARLLPSVARDSDVAIVSEAEVRSIAPTVHERVRQAGSMDRDGAWWDLTLGVASWPGRPHEVLTHVVVRDRDGRPSGYAGYRVKDDWQGRLPNATAEVQDLQAATPAAYAALWGHLVELDLCTRVEASGRPVDEPLPWLLTDARRARLTHVADFLWTRLLDVPAALSARTYSGGPARVGFAVRDARGWAAGRFVLEVDGSGRGVCTRVDGPGREGTATATDGGGHDGGGHDGAGADGAGADGAGADRAGADRAGHDGAARPSVVPPEVTLDVVALSSAWLGGGDLLALVPTGAVEEHSPGALERFAALLHTSREPWAPDWF